MRQISKYDVSPFNTTASADLVQRAADLAAYLESKKPK